jgi:hypothetical protein
MAELYHVLAQNPNASASLSFQFKTMCAGTLMNVVSVAQRLDADEFRLLDPFLGVRPRTISHAGLIYR